MDGEKYIWAVWKRKLDYQVPMKDNHYQEIHYLKYEEKQLNRNSTSIAKYRGKNGFWTDQKHQGLHKMDDF